MILFFDSETTGLDYKQDQMLSVAYIIYDGSGKRLEKEIKIKLRKDILPSAEALSVNKINPFTKDWSSKTEHEAILEMVNDIKAFCGETKPIFCAYNASFDSQFVKRAMFLSGIYFYEVFDSVLDAMAIASRLVDNGTIKTEYSPSSFGPSKKLSSVARALGVEYNGDAHTALADVDVLARSFFILADKLSYDYASLKRRPNVDATYFIRAKKKEIDGAYYIIHSEPHGVVGIKLTERNGVLVWEKSQPRIIYDYEIISAKKIGKKTIGIPRKNEIKFDKPKDDFFLNTEYAQMATQCPDAKSLSSIKIGKISASSWLKIHKEHTWESEHRLSFNNSLKTIVDEHEINIIPSRKGYILRVTGPKYMINNYHKNKKSLLKELGDCGLEVFAIPKVGGSLEDFLSSVKLMVPSIYDDAMAFYNVKSDEPKNTEYAKFDIPMEKKLEKNEISFKNYTLIIPE